LGIAITGIGCGIGEGSEEGAVLASVSEGLSVSTLSDAGSLATALAREYPQLLQNITSSATWFPQLGHIFIFIYLQQ
jgi:hypothetical protein